MGGTLAADVALGHFAEATLGCEDPKVWIFSMIPMFFNSSKKKTTWEMLLKY